MLQLLMKLNTLLCIILSVEWKSSNSLHTFRCNSRKYNNREMISSPLHVNKYTSSNFLFIKCLKKDIILLKRKNKIRCSSSKKEEDDNLEADLKSLMKDLEEGKMGEESLKLYKEIEHSSAMQEEEEARLMEVQHKKMNMYKVEEVIKNTDDNLKKSVMKAFYNTEINDMDNPHVKKEYSTINKIEKTFDELDETDEVNNSDEKLNIKNIYKKINSMKDTDHSEIPFKDTAKTLLKYKGLLHMPFERCPLLNNGYFDWRESLDYIELNIPVFEETNQEDILFHFRSDHVKLEIRKNGDKTLMLDDKLCGRIDYDDAYWVITSDYKAGERHINLIMPKIGCFKYIWEKLLQDRR
ncbi:conserved Plasmodium protein, unknown function [Plasmodium ovale]|uniref:CS domain-containing protein n=1 Tax=Plasmodium ovale TaxID=36330 RepID=A0A1D3TKS1_PLAOA|nr:conserved Plasmodium protein, unknown function [Plasmodium ovale]